MANSRRNLYHTGAFSLVDVIREEITSEPAAQSADRPPLSSAQKPVRLIVRVQEVQPFELRYGGFYDTERGPGVIADLTNRNTLHSARTAGLRIRYDSQLKEARLYFTQPLLRNAGRRATTYSIRIASYNQDIAESRTKHPRPPAPEVRTQPNG